MNQVPLHSRFDAAFESSLAYENPVQDLRLTVEFTHSAEVFQVDAFWDGEQCWRIRFAPVHLGQWSWRTQCSRIDDKGLHGQIGHFECTESTSGNEWLINGPLRISQNRHYLEYANGKPFFWLGDTAWNGPLKAGANDWDVYLVDRKAKGFSVIQFVATQWLGGATDAEGRAAFTDVQRIRIDPAFFKRLDLRIDRINDFGFVAAPVLAWAKLNRDSLTLDSVESLSDDQLIVLIRYLVSRYGAHQVVWILAGDGYYLGDEAERWRRVGRATLSGSPRLATMHPAARIWVNQEFEQEPWYSINGYQSGQWKGPESPRWINERLLEKPPLQTNTTRSLPTINLEPCYEDHIPLDVPDAGRIDALTVRRASYWSLFAAPVAGISYGAHGIWSWEQTPSIPLNHSGSGVALPWREAIKLPGSTCILHLSAIFKSIDWWRLIPCQQMLAWQPGINSPLEFVAAACTPERDLALLYSPGGGSVSICTDFFAPESQVSCIDPATGQPLWTRQWRDGQILIESGVAADRLLLIRLHGKKISL